MGLHLSSQTGDPFSTSFAANDKVEFFNIELVVSCFTQERRMWPFLERYAIGPDSAFVRVPILLNLLDVRKRTFEGLQLRKVVIDIICPLSQCQCSDTSRHSPFLVFKVNSFFVVH